MNSFCPIEFGDIEQRLYNVFGMIMKKGIKVFREFIHLNKLYEAVEKVFLPLNNWLQERVHRHEVRCQEILVELASLKRQKEIPLTKLSKKHIAAFCSAFKERLLCSERSI